MTEDDLRELGLDLSEVEDITAIADSHACLGNLATQTRDLNVAVVPVGDRWLHFSCGENLVLYDTSEEANAAMARDIADTIELVVDPDSPDCHDVHERLDDTDDSVTVCGVGSTSDGYDHDLVLTVWRHNGTPGWDSHTSYESALQSALYEANRIAERVGSATAAPLVQAVEISIFEAAMDDDGGSVPDDYERHMAISDDGETHFLVEVGGLWTHANDGYPNAISWKETRADAARNLLNAVGIKNLILKEGYNWVSPDEQDRICVIEQEGSYALVWVLGDTAGLEPCDLDLDDEGLAEASARAARILRDHQEYQEANRTTELSRTEQINADAMRRRVLLDQVEAVETALGDNIRRGHHENLIGRYRPSGISWKSLTNSLGEDRVKVYEIRDGKFWPKDCTVVYDLVTDYHGTAGVQVGPDFDYLPPQVEDKFAKHGYGPDEPGLWILVSPEGAVETNSPEPAASVTIGIPSDQMRALHRAIDAQNM
ncbi:hypothetical protein [Streptomyces botrytidirepellens]|uniref:hypothetical protein n=1 Tax=Streptomyces botrytidirepellens TaxID=2486417 RepID=UPI0011CE03AC|nr:hypothetical protein [Streptomyces botrytidirepellens]